MGARRARDGLSAQEARWLAIAAQGLDRERPVRRVTDGDVAKLVARLGALQLDAINVVARTQHLTVFNRIGDHDPQALSRLSGPGGRLWEFWGHAASLLPLDLHTALRWRMEHGGAHVAGPKIQARRDAWEAAHTDYLAAVFEEVRQRGPLTAAQLSDPRRRLGEWWERRSVGRDALEWLYSLGRLAAWRTPAFERVYDLPERVFPAAVLDAPALPVDEAHRLLLLRSAQALGVATVKDLAWYFMLQLTPSKARVAELVAAGELAPVAVEGWAEPGYVLPGARPARPRRAGATLLAPFDSLVWYRARTSRLFGFDYTIEVYVPAPKRQYGYYVLPVLHGDRLVGRLDLKADRQSSVLRVQAAHGEPRVMADGQNTAAVAAATVAELDALRSWLGLDDLHINRRGDLARALLAA